MRIVTPCPHCKGEVCVEAKSQKQPPASFSYIVLLFFVTLASAFAGCYLFGMVRDFQLMRSLRQAENDQAARERQQVEELREKIRRSVMDGK